MKQHEKHQLLQRIEAFWPSLFRNRQEVFEEFSRRLDSPTFEAGAYAVNALIETKKAGNPSVAELVSFLPVPIHQKIENDCVECEGTGWVFTTADSVVDCKCTPRSDEVKRSDKPPKPSSEGKYPATLDEAKRAFERGLKASEIF